MTFAGIKEAQPRADLLAFLKEAAEKGGSQTVQQGGPMGGMGGMPTLETWRATTGLPWIGFWFRELLRWGTLDPLVAFALAQGLARTRDEAALLRPEFEAWLAAKVLIARPKP